MSNIFSIEEKRLNIGNRGKLGGTNDGCIGINDDKIIAEAMKKYCHSYGDVYKKHYPSNTWFKFINIKERNPMLIIVYPRGQYTGEVLSIQKKGGKTLIQRKANAR